MSVKRRFWRHWLCWKSGVIVIDGGFLTERISWKKRGEKVRERERERERKKERKSEGRGDDKSSTKIEVPPSHDSLGKLPPHDSCHLCLAQTVGTEVACVACEGRYGWGIWGQLLTTGTAILHCFPSCLSNFFLLILYLPYCSCFFIGYFTFSSFHASSLSSTF